jgi:hypothetical protein
LPSNPHHVGAEGLIYGGKHYFKNSKKLMKRIIVILLGCMFLLSFVSLAEDNQQGEKKKPRTASKTVHMYNYPKYQVLGSIYEQGDEADRVIQRQQHAIPRALKKVRRTVITLLVVSMNRDSV